MRVSFSGVVDKIDGQTAHLKDARRIHYWDGAASLSLLATDGQASPHNCRFPCTQSMKLLPSDRALFRSPDKAKASIEGVKPMGRIISRLQGWLTATPATATPGSGWRQQRQHGRLRLRRRLRPATAPIGDSPATSATSGYG